MSFSVNGAVFLIAVVLSYALAPLMIKFAWRYRLLDYPHGRKAHPHPTPFLGGAGIFITFWIVVFVGIPVILDLHSRHPFLGERSFVTIAKANRIFLGGLILFVLGLLDDRYDLPPWPKLAGQAAAALILIKSGIMVNLVVSLGIFGDFITFAWLILMMNAFNFIDSVDGHCGGIGLISCLIFFAISVIVYQPVVGFVVAAFGGALLGFLPYNMKPAKMFLGDNGSLMIGYIMGAITILCTYRTPYTYSGLTPFIPILMFGVPIYDTVSVIAVRLFRGIPPWKGDRNHFAHRLVRLGMSDKIAVLFSYFTSITLGLVALLSTQVNTTLGKVLVMSLFISIIAVISFLEYYAALRIRRMEQIAAQRKRRREEHS